LVNKTGIKILW